MVRAQARDGLIQSNRRGAQWILRCSGDIALGRQVIEKGRHLRRAEILRVPSIRENDKSANSMNVGLLGPAAVVASSDRVPDLIEQAGALRGVGHCFLPEAELIFGLRGSNVLTAKEDDRLRYILVGLQTDEKCQPICQPNHVRRDCAA